MYNNLIKDFNKNNQIKTKIKTWEFGSLLKNKIQ